MTEQRTTETCKHWRTVTTETRGIWRCRDCGELQYDSPELRPTDSLLVKEARRLLVAYPGGGLSAYNMDEWHTRREAWLKAVMAADETKPFQTAEAAGHWATDTGHCAPGCPVCAVAQP